MSERALLVLNRGARRGTAPRRYAAVRDIVRSRFALAEVDFLADGAWREALQQALGEGVRTFLAAGGDGTVNAVAGALVALRDGVPLQELTLGAVGLGSSNDFHKPFREVVHGVALRLDAGRATPRDVARATYEDGRGGRHARLFLVSASLGTAAAANALFNQPDVVLRFLKRRLTGAAILYAATRAIARHRDTAARLGLPEGTVSVALSSLSVLKTPFLSGAFRYDTPVGAASGLLAVNLLEGRGRLGLLAALLRLQRGRFLGRPGARHWMLDRVSVELDQPADLELDGEIVEARRVEFDLLPERLSVCA